MDHGNDYRRRYRRLGDDRCYRRHPNAQIIKDKEKASLGSGAIFVSFTSWRSRWPQYRT
jgi:hypothetical protein